MERVTLIAIAVGFSIAALVSTSYAGVVLSETSVATSPAGATILNRTIYVQGNKQKVEKPGVDSITDLDKGVVYIVDKRHRKYLEMPIADSRSDPKVSRDSGGDSILLDKTPDTRVVANQTCTEYRGGHTNQIERIAVSACVSRNAPGTSEVIAFDQKFSHAIGIEDQVARKGAGESAGLVLVERSMVSIRVPDLAGGDAYRIASFAHQTEVREIRLRRLPEATFAPPENFTRVTGAPPPPTRRQTPPAHDRDEFEV